MPVLFLSERMSILGAFALVAILILIFFSIIFSILTRGNKALEREQEKERERSDDEQRKFERARHLQLELEMEVQPSRTSERYHDEAEAMLEGGWINPDEFVLLSVDQLSRIVRSNKKTTTQTLAEEAFKTNAENTRWYDFPNSQTK